MPRRTIAAFAMFAMFASLALGPLSTRACLAAGEWTGDFSLPVSDGRVRDAQPMGDDLIVGGSFLHLGDVKARGLARWDGREWSEFAGGANGEVRGLTIWRGQLVAAGGFTEIGGVAAQHVASWNGSRWAPLDLPLHEGGSIIDVGSDGSDLLIGEEWPEWNPDHVSMTETYRRKDDAWTAGAALDLGEGFRADLQYFTEAGGVLTALWSINDLGFEIDSYCGALSEWVDGRWIRLPAPGGNFSCYFAGYGDRESRIAAVYAGTIPPGMDLYRDDRTGHWISVGRSPSNHVWSVTRHAGNPVVQTSGGIYSVENHFWRNLGVSAAGRLRWIPWGDALLAVGRVTSIGAAPFADVAAWDGSRWTALAPQSFGDGADGIVDGFAADANWVIAEGDFQWLGRAAAAHTAEYRDGRWRASGLEDVAPYGHVLDLRERIALLVHFVGDGYELARWNGQTLLRLGVCNASVAASAEFDGRLVCAGSFGSIRASTDGVIKLVNRVAAFDGVAWIDWGEGVDFDVTSLIRCNEDLIAAGTISAGADRGMTRVSRWREGYWEGMGSPLPFRDARLGFAGGRLYVAGTAEPNSPRASSQVARWDAGHWTTVGEFGAQLRAIETYNGRLIVGGGEESVPDSFRVLLRSFDGSAWSELGAGVDRPVWALGATDDGLWVGGQFLTAGGRAAARLAKWRDEFAAVSDLRGEIEGDEVHLSWRTPTDPGFAGCIVRWSTDYAIRDAADGMPLGGGALLPGRPGEAMAASVPVAASASKLFAAVFSVDHTGLYSRAARVEVARPDTEPPSLSLGVTALIAEPGRLELRVGANEELRPESIALRLDGVQIEIEPVPVGHFIWRGAVRREVKGTAELRLTAADLAGHVTSTSLELASNSLIWSGDSTMVSPDGQASFFFPEHSVNARHYVYVAQETDRVGARTYHLSASSRFNFPFTVTLHFDAADYDSSALASLKVTRDGAPLNTTRDLERREVRATSLVGGSFRIDPPPPAQPVGDPKPPLFKLVLPKNPCLGPVALELAMDHAAGAHVAIYDIQGREVERLFDGALPAGKHELRWDGRDARGRATPAGIYFVRAESDGDSRVVSVCRLK